MPTWLKVLMGVAVAYAAYVSVALVLWRSSGSCMLVSQPASPAGGVEAEISTCGSSANSLETTIWLRDASTKVRALHAKSPVDQDLFERGQPALMSKIAQDYRLTWIDGSHLEISCRLTAQRLSWS